MIDGIYTCDVDDYLFLLSRDGSRVSRSQDWFFWWLEDNGVEYSKVSYVCYNELQGTIYTLEFDDSLLIPTGKQCLKQKNRARGVWTMRDYPVRVDPPQILLDRWDWLMEEIRGSEREICAAS